MKLGTQRPEGPAKGVRYGNQRQHVVRFDDDMFAAVRAVADRDGISFSEAARNLIARGLKARGKR